MQNEIPQGTRLASRVVLIGPNQSVLYLRAQEPKSKKVFWVMPGGGLDNGESFEQAARRELQEETGCSLTLGPCVWYRRHRHQWNGKPADQYERFFVAHTDSLVIAAKRQDHYIADHKWWTMDELRASQEEFAPRRIAEVLPPILDGNYPDEPIDCGV